MSKECNAENGWHDWEEGKKVWVCKKCGIKVKVPKNNPKKFKK